MLVYQWAGYSLALHAHNIRKRWLRAHARLLPPQPHLRCEQPVMLCPARCDVVGHTFPRSLWPPIMCSPNSYYIDCDHLLCFRSGNAGRTFMKLLVAADTDVVVGCHMVRLRVGCEQCVEGGLRIKQCRRGALGGVG